jgi:conjugative relaxase-like TrwC/TraI family protein
MGVSLKKITGRSEEVLYPWEEVEQARARDEYLREHGRSNVTWIGDARARGFTGEPTQEDAQLLLNGRAGDGELLLRGCEVQGYDLTFSMPKDVSVTYAVSGPEVRRELEDAFDRAFGLTMEKFEEHLLVVRVGSGRREAERGVVPASGVVGIRYEHAYSREGDPQLHYHAMISSIVQDPEGQLKRLWLGAGGMRELKLTLGNWHEAFLREEISRAFPGLEWEPVGENGLANFARFPASLRTVMSKRARAISEEVEVWEHANGRKANSAVRQMITLQTRPRKPPVPDHAQWTAEMLAIAQEHGLTPEFVHEMLNGPAVAQRSVDPAELAERLLGPEGLTRTQTRFRKSDVIVAVLQAGVPGSQVEEYVEAILSDPRVIAIKTRKGVTYLSEELVRAERAIERMAREGIDAVPQLAITYENAMAAIESVAFELTAGQREVVIAAATSADLLVPVEATAGTGKTTAAGVIRAALEREGMWVRGAAPTGKAAVELQDGAGIPTRTIHSLKQQVQSGGSLGEGRYRVLCVDEGGMADTRTFAWLLGQAEREGMRVIVFGDSQQLTSVAPGGWLGYLSRAGIRPALRMDEIVRQHDPGHRRAVNGLSRGRPGTWINYQKEHGNVIHLGAGQEHQYGARAAELLIDAAERRGWEHVLAVTPTNLRRELINELVQHSRLEAGQLGQKLGESSEHELFHAGDRVMFVGRNDRRRNLQNGLIGTVIERTEGGELVMALDQEGTEVRVLPAPYVAENLRLAYAVTDYKGQGATVEETIMVAAPEELSLNRGYVAASRARDQTQLVLVSQQSTEQALKDLARQLKLREDDELAIEHLDQAATPPSAQRQEAQNRWLSSHRARIEELGRGHEPKPQADLGQWDARLAEIEDRRREIELEDERDNALLRAPGRKHRQQQRDLQLHAHASERTTLQAARAAEAAQRLEVQQRIAQERETLVAAAGTEEVARRIDGRHAPWIERALGPEPLPEHPGLLERWTEVAEYLARLRIDRGITDPAEIGISDRDAMLTKDIRTLRGHIQQARTLGADAPPSGLMRGRYRPGFLRLPAIGADRGQSMGIGE